MGQARQRCAAGLLIFHAVLYRDMNNSLYDTSIPVFTHGLQNLLKILAKTKRHAVKKRLSINTLLTARLAPDMYNLIQQVQYAYFMALEAACNLSGRKMPDDFNYDEKTVGDLEKNTKMAISFLASIKPKELKGVEKKRLTTFLDPKAKFKADAYVTHLAVPNFFFHVTTAYDILRHKGVALGKDDFLGI